MTKNFQSVIRKKKLPSDAFGDGSGFTERSFAAMGFFSSEVDNKPLLN